METISWGGNSILQHHQEHTKAQQLAPRVEKGGVFTQVLRLYSMYYMTYRFARIFLGWLVRIKLVGRF